jgi:hypothetical protein
LHTISEIISDVIYPDAAVISSHDHQISSQNQAYQTGFIEFWGVLVEITLLMNQHPVIDPLALGRAGGDIPVRYNIPLDIR